MTSDNELHDHDLGLAFDLSTLVQRRQALKIFGGAGLLALAGCGSSKLAAKASAGSSTTGATSATTAEATATSVASAVNTVIPEETAGPYPGDGSNGVNVLSQSGIVRGDIASSFGTSTTVAKGLATTIKLKIVNASNGKAMAGAAVYVWHADINGNYSMYSQAVKAENYLRGVQETDANGDVTFKTIYPGCYDGRWPHVHFEVYPSLAKATASGSKIATSQLALPDDTCKLVYATEGYAKSVTNLAKTSLKTDNVFSDGATAETPVASGSVTTGIALNLTVAVKG
jgi:protocatechuate 3,4-dioxygenase beta subunit